MFSSQLSTLQILDDWLLSWQGGIKRLVIFELKIKNKMLLTNSYNVLKCIAKQAGLSCAKLSTD